MKVRSLTVSSEFGLDFLVLRWILFAPSEPITEDCTYDVLRAPDPGGPYTVIGSALPLNYVYYDRTVNLRRREVRYAYKLRYTTPEDGVRETDPVVWRCEQGDAVAAEIIRQHKDYLRLANAPVCRFFLVKTDTVRCQCYDTTRKGVKMSRCPLCYGTGWVGGYWGPYDAPVSFSLTAAQRKLYPFEATSDNSTEPPQRCWTVNFPLLSPGDILVTPLNERYSIVNVQKSRRGLTWLHQVFTASRLPTSSIAYDVGEDR